MPPVSFSLPRRLSVLFVALSLFGLAGCTAPSTSEHPAAAALAPAPVRVERTALMKLANEAADQRSGGFVVVIDTDDMLPRYPRGTAVVVETVNFADLREGMVVLFHRGDGAGCCTHQLVLRTPDGWITRGTNSREDDPQPMTAANYVGRIVAAFTAELPETAVN